MYIATREWIDSFEPNTLKVVGQLRYRYHVLRLSVYINYYGELELEAKEECYPKWRVIYVNKCSDTVQVNAIYYTKKFATSIQNVAFVMKHIWPSMERFKCKVISCESATYHLCVLATHEEISVAYKSLEFFHLPPLSHCRYVRNTCMLSFLSICSIQTLQSMLG